MKWIITGWSFYDAFANSPTVALDIVDRQHEQEEQHSTVPRSLWRVICWLVSPKCSAREFVRNRVSFHTLRFRSRIHSHTEERPTLPGRSQSSRSIWSLAVHSGRSFSSVVCSSNDVDRRWECVARKPPTSWRVWSHHRHRNRLATKWDKWLALKQTNLVHGEDRHPDREDRQSIRRASTKIAGWWSHDCLVLGVASSWIGDERGDRGCKPRRVFRKPESSRIESFETEWGLHYRSCSSQSFSNSFKMICLCCEVWQILLVTEGKNWSSYECYVNLWEAASSINSLDTCEVFSQLQNAVIAETISSD